MKKIPFIFFVSFSIILLWYIFDTKNNKNSVKKSTANKQSAREYGSSVKKDKDKQNAVLVSSFLNSKRLIKL